MAIKQHIHAKTGKPLHRGLKAAPLAERQKRMKEAKQFSPKASPPPEFWCFPLYLSMWGNGPDPNWPNPAGDGDCVSARQAFAKACSGIKISDPTLYAFCQKNNLLNGADLPQVNQLMQQQGFSQDGNTYLNGPNDLAVNISDIAAVRAAIYEAGNAGGFAAGCLSAGIAADELPANAGTMGFFLTSDNPDTNEDHNVGYCGYGTAQGFIDNINKAYAGTPFLPTPIALPAGVDPEATGIAVFTWESIGFVFDTAMQNMTGELYIEDPQTLVKGTNPVASCGVYLYPSVTPPPPPPTPTGTITYLTTQLAALIQAQMALQTPTDPGMSDTEAAELEVLSGDIESYLHPTPAANTATFTGDAPPGTYTLSPTCSLVLSSDTPANTYTLGSTSPEEAMKYITRLTLMLKMIRDGQMAAPPPAWAMIAEEVLTAILAVPGLPAYVYAAATGALMLLNILYPPAK